MSGLSLENGGDLRVLVLGAHPDDEMGCAGTLARLDEAGAEVHHYYFSDCAVSTEARGFEPQVLLKECEQSRDVLGIDEAHRGAFDYPVRRFPEFRQQILEDLIGLRTAIQPNLVLTACRSDNHQDHAALTAEAFRAFKYATILGYELPWNNPTMQYDLFVALEQRHIDRKLESLRCYASQTSAAYADPEVPRGLARVRGVQCGAQYAECFEVIRAVI